LIFVLKPGLFFILLCFTNITRTDFPKLCLSDIKWFYLQKIFFETIIFIPSGMVVHIHEFENWYFEMIVTELCQISPMRVTTLSDMKLLIKLQQQISFVRYPLWTQWKPVLIDFSRKHSRKTLERPFFTK